MNASLIERLQNGECGNDLDVLLEIALFEPDGVYLTVRANDAGTKVVYGLADGSQETCWAYEWTMFPKRAIARLRETDTGRPDDYEGPDAGMHDTEITESDDD